VSYERFRPLVDWRRSTLGSGIRPAQVVDSLSVESIVYSIHDSLYKDLVAFRHLRQDARLRAVTINMPGHRRPKESKPNVLIQYQDENGLAVELARTSPPVRDKITPPWFQRFMGLAVNVSSWSKDPSTRVGAVIVNEDRRVIGLGYNGFAKGVKDTPERLADRPTKYALVVHAEMNAILNAVVSVRGCALVTTMYPCSECAKLIAQAGIACVACPAVREPRHADDTWKRNSALAKVTLIESGVWVDDCYEVIP